MKTQIKLILVGLAMTLANLSVASVNIKDGETEVDVNKDYRRAESMIGEVVADNPDDARDHYLYSRILHHNGKNVDAVRELMQAKRLDPALSFVRNPKDVVAYETELNAEGGHAIASNPMPVHRVQGKAWLWLLLIPGVLGVAAFFAYRHMQEKDRKREEKRMKLVRCDQSKYADALLESLKSLKLDISMTVPLDSTILDEVESVELQLLGLIDRLRQLPVPQSEIYQNAENLARLRRKFEENPEPDSVCQAVNQQLLPQNLAVENSSGDTASGLASGMAVSNLIHEVAVIHEILEVPGRRSENDDSESDIDFGTDSGSSNGRDIDFEV